MNSKNLKGLVTVIAAVLFTNVFAYASKTDDRIVSSAEESYVFRAYLHNDAIDIKSTDGVVTLTGTVTEESHKLLAKETVENLPGVKSVDNQLETEEEVKSESKDTWISRKIMLTLLFHKNVNASKTKIDVKEGVVTLRGEASSLPQKELTSEYASDIDGVKEVKNEMTVSKIPEPSERTDAEKMDDASITAQVKTALSTHRSTSAMKVKVETRNGEVTLTGITMNEAEKSLATKLVTDIRGVTSVSNQMTVEEPTTK